MRLIDADELRQEWLENGKNEYIYDTNSFLDSIDDQPTINPETLPIARELREQLKKVTAVSHGKWIFNDDWWEFICTNCHKGIGNIKKYPFCPNCGARMDEEE